MKKLIFALIVVVALITVSMANGASESQAIFYKGVLCKTSKGAIVCVREDGKGYAIGLSKDVIVVMHGHKTVIARSNR